jgi:hypothetical protein
LSDRDDSPRHDLVSAHYRSPWYEVRRGPWLDTRLPTSCPSIAPVDLD